MSDDKELGLADFMPHRTQATAEGFRAVAGTPRENLSQVNEETVITALKTVHDPEIPINIYDLGLIYSINCFADGNIHITMSLTAPGCPVAGEMPGMVAEAVAGLAGTGLVEVDLVWEPAWTKERMSADARLALDMI